MISKKYAKANNPYLEDYNTEDPTSYTVYLKKGNIRQEVVFYDVLFAFFTRI